MQVKKGAIDALCVVYDHIGTRAIELMDEAGFSPVQVRAAQLFLIVSFVDASLSPVMWSCADEGVTRTFCPNEVANRN